VFRTKRLVGIFAIVSLIVLPACSADTEIRGGTITPPPSPAATQTETPIPEPSLLTEGVLEPSNVPTLPSQDPSLLRYQEAPEAVKYAQAFAAALLYFNILYVPGAEKLGTSVMQGPPGLSITQAVKWYDYVENQRTYRQNQSVVDGYLFIPPERDRRRYAVPAVQDIRYTTPKISEGPPSSIDSRPTLEVSFQIGGRLIWIEKDGTAWEAPLRRTITYVMASENDGWVIDDWENARVEIGTREKIPSGDIDSYSFTPWETLTDSDPTFTP